MSAHSSRTCLLRKTLEVGWNAGVDSRPASIQSLPNLGRKASAFRPTIQGFLRFVSLLKSIPSKDLWAGSPKVTPVETGAAR